MRLFTKSAVVLLLTLGFFSPVLAVDSKPANVYEILKDHKELHLFAEMVSDSGLKDTLTSKNEVLTVFAPTDSAIDKLPSDVRKRMNKDKVNLQSFVKYHIISGSLVRDDNIRGRRASPSTLSGEMISFDGVSGPAPKVNGALLVKPNLEAGNGVVHSVDTAFIPPSLTQADAQPQPAPAKAATGVNPSDAGIVGNPDKAVSVPAMPQAVLPAPPAKADEGKKSWFKSLFSK